MYEEIYAQAKQACNELCDVAKLKEGSIVVTVRQLASNTKISKIIELIGNSEELKAGVQIRAETLADRIVPFSFIGFFCNSYLHKKHHKGSFTSYG